MNTKSIRNIGLLLLAGLFTPLGRSQPTLPQAAIPDSVGPSIRPLLDQLYSPRPVDRMNAAIKLGALGDKAEAAVPYLVSMLGDTSSEVVSNGMFTLIAMPGQCASDALAKIGASAVPPLREASQNATGTSQYQAIRALGFIKSPEAQAALIPLFRHADAGVRQAAVDTLTWSENPETITNLAEALKDPNSRVRTAAAEALNQRVLKKTVDQRAFDLAATALGDPEKSVRRWAIRILAKIKDAPAVELLIKALGDSEKDIAATAQEALEEISGKKLGPDPEAWRKWQTTAISGK